MPPILSTAIEIARDVRSGTRSPEDAVAESLQRIEVGDGRLGAFQVVRGEAAAAEARGARPGARTSRRCRWPASRRGQGQRRRRRRADARRVGGDAGRAADQRPRRRRTAARRRRHRGRPDQDPGPVRLRCHRLDLRHQPQPLGPVAYAGRVVRRQRRGGRRRARPGRARQRRARLDPDPGGLLRRCSGSSRASASCRPGSATNSWYDMVRERSARDDGRRRRAHALGDGRRVPSWPRSPSRSGRCGSPSRCARRSPASAPTSSTCAPSYVRPSCWRPQGTRSPGWTRRTRSNPVPRACPLVRRRLARRRGSGPRRCSTRPCARTAAIGDQVRRRGLVQDEDRVRVPRRR